MAAKFVSEGKVLRYVNTAGTAVLKGAVVLVGSLVGVALEDIPAGGTGAVAVSGIFEAPKAAEDVSQGVKLYFNGSALTVSTNSGSNPFAGYAAEAAATGDATVRILLHPPGA